MKIVKRNGKKENVKFEKIFSRVKKQTYDLNTEYVDAHKIAQKVIADIYEGITTKELDDLATRVAASNVTKHPDYSYLASRIAITSLYKQDTIEENFSNNIENLYNYKHPITKEKAGMISDEVFEFIMENRDVLDSEIVKDRDFKIDYFGFKTLEKAYLLKRDGLVSETPQFMFMRVACGIWGGKDGSLGDVLETYHLMSQKYFIHATPTLFNAGTKRPQMSSCFLLSNEEGKGDSIESIFKMLGDVAQISKNSGGIGIAMHDIRGKGTYVKGTNGVSSGIIPYLKIFNETARAVDQAGKRKGSFAIYLEPWHADVEDFLRMRTNTGKEELKARDLFSAMWVPDLFYERVQNNDKWTLFSPDTAKGLYEVYGEEFKELYEKYEAEGLGVKEFDAVELNELIDKSRIETGTPYILSKDSCNEKSNQKNLGTIKSSNLCAEIVEYTDSNETAVCNLASIALPSFVEHEDKRKEPEFNFEKLKDIAYRVTINLNRVIDKNFYPTPETKNSNMKHRPIGLGVQGLADTFALMDMGFDSDEAKELNVKIFETMYYGSLLASNDLAKKHGSYESFEGSPTSKGILQFDMWKNNTVDRIEVEDVKGNATKKWEVVDSQPIKLSGMWDFDKLKENIKKYGLRNSLNLAEMPTASTSQILGNTESFQPFNSLLYKRETLSGEFPVINAHFINDMCKLGKWNNDVRYKLIKENGSVQNIVEVPQELKDKYKIVWDIKQRDLIDMSADRSPFICQSQSFNLFLEKLTLAKLKGATLYGWKKGLKTISYYVHTRTDSQTNQSLGITEESSIDNSNVDDSINDTVVEEVNKTSDVEKMGDLTEEEMNMVNNTCSLDDPDCEACSA